MSSRRVLIPLPDRDFDVTEVAVPWRVLSRAGHRVEFATEAGAIPHCDPLLLTGVLFGKLGAEAEPRRFYADLQRDPAFRSPVRWSDVDPGAYDGWILPGGHAPGMRQYLGSEVLQRKIAAFWKLERPVGAICHGVLALARAVDPDTRRSVLDGHSTTSLPRYMEALAYGLTGWKLGRYYRTYPAYVQDEVTAALGPRGTYVRGPWTLAARGTDADDRHAFVHTDGRYVSARWPGDAYLFARSFQLRLDAMAAVGTVVRRTTAPIAHP